MKKWLLHPILRHTDGDKVGPLGWEMSFHRGEASGNKFKAILAPHPHGQMKTTCHK
jgi:hypothetical protein